MSQSGFPALAVPGVATPVPPQGNVISYSLPNAQMRVIGVETIDEGTIPVEEAASRFEDRFSDTFRSLNRVGDAGNQLVPMIEYTYEFNTDAGPVPGIAHVFSGQGKVWALDCNSAETGEIPPDLQTACDRAVETIGFLMF